jgi:hypothetical protein
MLVATLASAAAAALLSTTTKSSTQRHVGCCDPTCALDAGPAAPVC